MKKITLTISLALFGWSNIANAQDSQRKTIAVTPVFVFGIDAMSTCIDSSKILKNVSCIQVYDPVCGCDGVTYGNSCVAFIAGITRTTKGECGAAILYLIQDIGTGIEEKTQFRLFPNPTTGKVTLNPNGTDIKTISVCNVLGEVLWQQPFSHPSETYNLEFGNNFPAGLYIISINTEDKVYRQKLIKQ